MSVVPRYIRILVTISSGRTTVSLLANLALSRSGAFGVGGVGKGIFPDGVTCIADYLRFQLVAISVDFLIFVKFLPPSNKQLRTHGKNFQGSHASGTAPESCLVNHEADTSIFISIIKDWSGPPSLQESFRIKSVAGHRNSNGSTTLCIRSKHSGAE